MSQFTHFVGVDIAFATFTACAGTTPWKLVVQPVQLDNSEDGFASLLDWMKDHNLKPEHTVVCMEATGVNGECLAYFLCASGYPVAVEPPLNIAGEFPVNASKSDLLDCTTISEYACRYADKLAIWQPRNEILEQVEVLLNMRQMLSAQIASHKNGLQAVNRKRVLSVVARNAHQEIIAHIDKQIRQIDAEIRRLIESDPTFK